MNSLYSYDTPGCDGWKEVVTSDGYVCHDCADELEQQYESHGKEAKLLSDSGLNRVGNR